MTNWYGESWPISSSWPMLSAMHLRLQNFFTKPVPIIYIDAITLAWLVLCEPWIRVVTFLLPPIGASNVNSYALFLLNLQHGKTQHRAPSGQHERPEEGQFSAMLHPLQHRHYRHDVFCIVMMKNIFFKRLVCNNNNFSAPYICYSEWWIPSLSMRLTTSR